MSDEVVEFLNWRTAKGAVLTYQGENGGPVRHYVDFKPVDLPDFKRWAETWFMEREMPIPPDEQLQALALDAMAKVASAHRYPA